jgi:hypothetical protein
MFTLAERQWRTVLDQQPSTNQFRENSIWNQYYPQSIANRFLDGCTLANFTRVNLSNPGHKFFRRGFLGSAALTATGM